MNNLYLGDCFEVMQDLIDNKIKVQAIITDPPYGKIKGMQLTGQKEKTDWDNKVDWKKFFELANKVLVDGGSVVMFGQNPTYAEMILTNKSQYKYEYIWLKNNCAQGFHSDKMPLIYTENIAVFIKDKSERVFNLLNNSKKIDKEKFPLRYYSWQLQKYIMEKFSLKSRKAIYQNMPPHKGKLDRRLEFFFFFNGTLFNPPSEQAYNTLIETYNLKEWENFKEHTQLMGKRVFNKEIIKDSTLLSKSTKNILKFSKDKPSYHPTQKPVKLMEYLVKTYTNENDVVLDPFMGGGSTGVASIKNNRGFIGVELDEKYFQIAKTRIEQEK